MLPYRDSRLTYIALGIFFCIVLGYAYFEARGILFGPSIRITSQPTEVHESFVLIKGTAHRIASLSMNGKTISVTETGAFEEPYLLAPGYNRIVLAAEDKYGRTQTQVMEIVLSQSPSLPVHNGTTTLDSTSSTPVAL